MIIEKKYLKQIILEEKKKLISEMELVYSDYTYITKVLNISIPLNESNKYILNDSLKAKILHEHILLENLIQSIKNAITKVTGPLKNLLITLNNVFSDRTGKTMENYNSLVNSKILFPIINNKQKTGLNDYIDKIINFISAKLPNKVDSIKPILENIKNKINSLYQKIKNMPKNDWKTTVASSGIAVILSWVVRQIKQLGIDSLQEVVVNKIFNWIKQFVETKITQDLAEKIISSATNVNNFLGFIGPIAGGVQFVADTLNSATSRMANTII